MKKTLLLALLAILHFHLIGNASAQIVGSPYTCCGLPNSGIVQIGDNLVSSSPAPYLATYSPIGNTVGGWLLISGAEDSNPWPLDPSAGWIFVYSDPQFYLGTFAMTPSGLNWESVWLLPPDPALAGTLLFFQVAKLDPQLQWVLSTGWTTELL